RLDSYCQMRAEIWAIRDQPSASLRPATAIDTTYETRPLMTYAESISVPYIVPVLWVTWALAGKPAGIPCSLTVWVSSANSQCCAALPPRRPSASLTQAAVRSSGVVVFGLQSAEADIPIDLA